MFMILSAMQAGRMVAGLRRQMRAKSVGDKLIKWIVGFSRQIVHKRLVAGFEQTGGKLNKLATGRNSQA